MQITLTDRQHTPTATTDGLDVTASDSSRPAQDGPAVPCRTRLGGSAGVQVPRWNDRTARDGRTLMSAREFALSCRNTAPRLHVRTRVASRRWYLTLATRAAVKRGLDIAGALTGVFLLAPLLILTALAIRLESRGPVLFRQHRVGKRGQPFTMYKFRSMRVKADAEKDALRAHNESSDGVIFKLRIDPRVTRVGRIIRRLSIDELPQLINVLLGHMSIVGPRPAVPDEVDQYDAEARKRLQTKPGLTCLWQIGGRSDLPFKQQVELDLRYLQQKSVTRDIVIIARTVPAVLSGKGAY